jgi:hypothetical protein
MRGNYRMTRKVIVICRIGLGVTRRETLTLWQLLGRANNCNRTAKVDVIVASGKNCRGNGTTGSQ